MNKIQQNNNHAFTVSTMKKVTLAVLTTLILSANAVAAEQEEYADMSDPMAVFNMGGVGSTNKGLNLKLVNTYDPGKANTLGANVIEVQGIAGEAMGWGNGDNKNNSISSIRYRNFNVDTTTGRGVQIDTSLNFNPNGDNTGSASYSLMQALPAMGRINLYPLAGAGVVMQDKESGISVPGMTALVGVYSKFTVSERIWLNYNPMYSKGFGGSMNDFDSLSHEVIASYQLNQRQNLRAFANWDNSTDFADADFRIEFNHQF